MALDNGGRPGREIESVSMPKAVRSYRQSCALAFALDAIGERWSLLVVRELLLGPRRFTDLATGIPGIATNILTTRLQELERRGLVTRREMPPPAASSVYELTERGRALEPAIVELVRWGTPLVAKSLRESKHGGHGGARVAPLRASWIALALKSFFSPSRARGTRGDVVFAFPTGSMTVSLRRGMLRIDDGEHAEPDARLRCREDVLIAIVMGGATVDALVARHEAEVSGDRAVLDGVLDAFRKE